MDVRKAKRQREDSMIKYWSTTNERVDGVLSGCVSECNSILRSLHEGRELHSGAIPLWYVE